ncbi:uncharacterized protein [Lepeophtheirus salmonis]|uniref:C-type lectin domain-containing protein n=1 Tax=Lepeophtheirus salmonis TaxID=72036 RepID=A0A0K2TPG5_LEPSM|nr:uncharacterized protein LOC121123935 isoform X3 [Lepeophtheirus salmonis]
MFGFVIFLLLHLLSPMQGQLFDAIDSLFSDLFGPPQPGFRPGGAPPPGGRFGPPFAGGPFPNQFQEQPNSFVNSGSGTPFPQATGIDSLFPADCGRNPLDGTGNLCFPDGVLCQQRVSRSGNINYGGHLYWVSWLSTDPQLRNTNWDWFNARNYCRKRCMDLVSFETREEYEFIKSQMGGVKYFWTSGRLCDFDGCDRPDFFPKQINGWFWSANQARLSPTNSTTAFHDWSFTGGFNPPRRQPDNREKIQQNGENESCLGVLNNFYGDGIKWHDVTCHHEKPIVCEDVEGHIAFARQNFPNLRIP